MDNGIGKDGDGSDEESNLLGDEKEFENRERKEEMLAVVTKRNSNSSVIS